MVAQGHEGLVLDILDIEFIGLAWKRIFIVFLPDPLDFLLHRSNVGNVVDNVARFHAVLATLVGLFPTFLHVDYHRPLFADQLFGVGQKLRECGFGKRISNRQSS
jgi:hypothetical protein